MRKAPCDEYPWGAKHHEASANAFLMYVSASNHYDSFIELRLDGGRWWITAVGEVDWSDE